MVTQDQLAARLRQERELLRKLLTLTADQRNCLITGAGERLGEIVSRQSELLQKLSRVSAKTVTALTNLSDSPPAARPEAAPEDAEHRRLREEVKDLTAILQQRARLNLMLAKEAMKYIDFSISLLGGPQEEQMYSPKGGRSSESAPMLMNKTA
jgi:flagellar biosynthesis/type III secretory pathway chaperone